MDHSVISYLRELDISVFQAINGYCGQNATFDRLLIRLDFSALKGLAFMASFGAMWFQRGDDQVGRRETLIIMIFAILVSIVAARAAAILLPFRIRPMFVPDIGYHAPQYPAGDYENWSAFPSDTATYFFVITTGFWLLSRWLGLLWVCFSTIVILVRVYLGIHYPSDVLAGALLGITITLLMNHEFVHRVLAARILAVEKRAPAIFLRAAIPYPFRDSNDLPFHESYTSLGIRPLNGLSAAAFNFD